MTELTITTLKGAEIKLTASFFGVRDDVIGRDFCYSSALLDTSAELGPHLVMGKAKAQISPADLDAVKALFAEHDALSARQRAEAAAEWEGSSAQFSARMHARMYGRNSDH